VEGRLGAVGPEEEAERVGLLDRVASGPASERGESASSLRARENVRGRGTHREGNEPGCERVEVRLQEVRARGQSGRFSGEVREALGRDVLPRCQRRERSALQAIEERRN